MPLLPFYSIGTKGVNRDIAPEEMDPREWSDVNNVRFASDKIVNHKGDSNQFGTHLATPYWLMPAQSGSTALWAYGSIGNSGNDSFTKSLLHFDAADASTTITDTNAGGAAHVWTARGNAQIDTADFALGTGSLLCDGTGDWVDTPDHADWILGASNFTINIRFKVAGADGAQLIMAGQADVGVTAAGSSFYIERAASNKVRFILSDGAAFTVLTSINNYQLAVNPGWHDLEVTRSGNTLFFFIDGVIQVVGGTAFAGTVPNSAALLSVGGIAALAAAWWNGWLDEWRFDVGVAKHTANFTPATENFGLSTEANLYVTDGSSHANVSRAPSNTISPYTVDGKKLWNGGTLSQIPIITDGVDKPQFWASPSLSGRFADLTNWPVNDRCNAIKPFKQFMVALAITRSGTLYQHLVKWSHPAVPGSVPASWDETDPTKLAGEVEILDELPGGIRDGGGLRDTFVIYKDNSTWGMQYIGGNDVFRFFPIFLNSGIMSASCFCPIDNGAAHFVATGHDFIIHDGQNMKNILSKRVENYLLSTIPSTSLDYCYCVEKAEKHEAWFCYPDVNSPNGYPNKAMIYNWKEETVQFRDMGNGDSAAAIGPIAASSDPWDLDNNTWDSDTTTWDFALFSPHSIQMLVAEPSSNTLKLVEDQSSVTLVGYVEKTGLAITGQDRVTGEYKADNDSMKLVDRVWIRATGDPINVSIGAQEFRGAPVVYQPSQLFTPGINKYLDFYPTNGRFIAVRFDFISSNNPTELLGYDINVTQLGDQ